MAASMGEHFDRWRCLAPSAASAKTAQAALKWTAILFKAAAGCDELSKGVGERLARVQGGLVTVIVGSGHSRLAASCRRTLADMWAHDEASARWAEKFLSAGSEGDVQMLVLASSYVEWLVGRKEEEGRAEDMKKPMLSGLAKMVISSKAKTERVVMKVGCPEL